MKPKPQTHTVRPKLVKNPKSSKRARRLIEAAIHRYGSERAAARVLQLPNHGQLNKMRRGIIKDTSDMKAALLRADKRADRAWLFVPTPKGTAMLDLEAVEAQLAFLDDDLETLTALIKPQS